MSALLDRMRARPRYASAGRPTQHPHRHRHRHHHRTVGGALIFALAFGAVGVTGAVVDQNADAAACDSVTIPSLDLTRCVIDGGQDVIDAGAVARYTTLSSATVHWLAGHRTSHGGTFGSLPNIRVGALVFYRGRAYVVVDYQLVNRYDSSPVTDWIYSATPSVVLQTSATSVMVHVWRSVELVPVTPVVAVAPPPIPAAAP